MQIFLKTLSGKTITIDIERDNTTVLQLKELIRQKTGTDIEQQRLIFAGKQLEDERSVYEYGVQAESTIVLVLRLKGGI